MEVRVASRASVPTTAARKAFARICGGHIDRRSFRVCPVNRASARTGGGQRAEVSPAKHEDCRNDRQFLC
jgi:hypothetical protein